MCVCGWVGHKMHITAEFWRHVPSECQSGNSKSTILGTVASVQFWASKIIALSLKCACCWVTTAWFHLGWGYLFVQIESHGDHLVS